MPLLMDLTGGRAKDRILCLHLIVCRSHSYNVISMIMPDLKVSPYKRQSCAANDTRDPQCRPRRMLGCMWWETGEQGVGGGCRGLDDSRVCIINQVHKHL